MAGRPTSLTPEVQAKILEAIRAGNYKATACALAGVHRDSLLYWEQRAEQNEEPYASFIEAFRQAEAEAESTLLAEIKNAQPAIPGEGGRGADVWTSRAWIMERRWPKRWASRVRTAVTEELGALLDRLEKKLDAETFKRVIHASREDASNEGAGDPRH